MTTTFISVALTNGVTSVPLNAGSLGQFEISLRAVAAPSAGALKIEGLQWTGGYVTIGGASALNLASGPVAVTDFGHFQALRFTITGLTSGTGPLVGAAVAVPVSVADLAFTGYRALVVQFYDETNAKNGTQFFFQSALPTFAASATYNIAFTTGALPVLVKDRTLYTNAASMSLQLFKAPTGVTGGTAISVQNYNDINPVATTVSVQGGVAVTAPGTAWGDPVRVFNAGASGQRTGSGLAPFGDRVLAPNSVYLIRLINGSGSAEADYFLTWYEGEPDLPRK